MLLRSLLFVPGDSQRKLARGPDSGADALILDLEDSVAPEHKPAAREQVAAFLADHPPGARTVPLWVRVNPVDTADCRLDLRAVLAGEPDGIVQPKPRTPADTRQLVAWLEEMRHPGAGIPILPLATETPGALFSLGGFAELASHLAGLTWGAEDLAAAIGALSNRDAAGQLTEPFRLARALCLFAAAAAEVPAIDAVYPDFRNSEGLRKDCEVSRRDGFSGRLAIHPQQVAIINQAYSPSEAEVAHARRVVELFDANPGAGTLALDGRMLDIPHLKQARRILLAVDE
ncbi:MAG: CoA ester lyase [Gammaproteobacteria bacterium]|jgi:citrate lyase subunit beta/citryl-CoA lyase|nr:CoA ester lyase [Gammaproteobacteria bacterium]